MADTRPQSEDNVMPDAEHSPSPGTNRRWFLQWSFFGLILATLGMAANVVIRYLMPAPSKLSKAEEVTVPVSQVPKGSGLMLKHQGHPVVAIHTEQGITAFNATCTHLGCLVKWVPEKKEFFCPCHAARFSETGEVLAGPAPEPLHRMPIEIVNDQIRFI